MTEIEKELLGMMRRMVEAGIVNPDSELTLPQAARVLKLSESALRDRVRMYPETWGRAFYGSGDTMKTTLRRLWRAQDQEAEVLYQRTVSGGTPGRIIPRSVRSFNTTAIKKGE